MLSFFDEWLERVHRVACDRGQIETFRPDLNQAVTDARQVQELVHESQKSLRLGIDRLEQFDGCGILVALSQQVDRVCDRRQRVPELMSQYGDELILPFAAGDQPRRHVRARGDVLDREQQLFAPLNIAGDSPRAQRHHLAPLGKKVPGNFPIFQRLGVGQQCAQSVVQIRDVPPAVAHFVKQLAFNLFAGDLQVRREC